MALKDDIALFQQLSIFEGLSDDHLRLLAFGAETTSLPADRKLYREDDEADSAYVVISGQGTFLCDGQRAPFAPGDLLWVPAGAEHRFEDFTDDLAVWVIFYGPEGGES